MEKLKKIAFVDIDGVLVTLRSFRQFRRSGTHAQADPDCVDALNTILVETGAHIVVSSSWRFNGGLGWLRNKFAEWGIHGAKSRTIGMTPRLPIGDVRHERGAEISAWLLQHPEVESFVILDDDADMGVLLNRLVQTEFERGLQAAHARRAIEMLNGK